MNQTKFIIQKQKRPLNSQFSRISDIGNDENKESNNGCLCFFLGFTFWVVGIIIAAIIGKTKGTVSALWGWFISTILFLLLYFFIIGANVHLR